MSKGIISLFPVPIAEGEVKDFLAPISLNSLIRAEIFFVEKAKVSRSILGQLGLNHRFEEVDFIETGKTKDPEEIYEALLKIASGAEGVLMSDSGMPCIGDPGWEIVQQSHSMGIQVIPFPGPNSFMQALMASGFEGQQFTFHGYLPIEKEKRKGALKKIGIELRQSGYTQIFMETPHRANELFKSILKELDSSWGLCIARDINGKTEEINTASIQDWKRINYSIPKVPAVFVLGQMN